MRLLYLLLFFTINNAFAQIDSSATQLIHENDTLFGWVKRYPIHLGDCNQCNNEKLGTDYNALLLEGKAISEYTIVKMWLDDHHILYATSIDGDASYQYMYGYVYSIEEEGVIDIVRLVDYLDEEGNSSSLDSHLSDYNKDGGLDIVQYNMSICAACDEEEVADFEYSYTLLLSWNGASFDTVRTGNNWDEYILDGFSKALPNPIDEWFEVCSVSTFKTRKEADSASNQLLDWIINKGGAPFIVYPNSYFVREEKGDFYIKIGHTDYSRASRQLYMLKNYPELDFEVREIQN